MRHTQLVRDRARHRGHDDVSGFVSPYSVGEPTRAKPASAADARGMWLAPAGASRRRAYGETVAVDFGAVFRVLVTLFGTAALLSGVAGVVGIAAAAGPGWLLPLALVSALLSLVFRLPARAAGRRSRDRVSLVASWVIVGVVGSIFAFLALLIWALSGWE
jgi:hypothetical protein